MLKTRPIDTCVYIISVWFSACGFSLQHYLIIIMKATTSRVINTRQSRNKTFSNQNTEIIIITHRRNFLYTLFINLFIASDERSIVCNTTGVGSGKSLKPSLLLFVTIVFLLNIFVFGHIFWLTIYNILWPQATRCLLLLLLFYFNWKYPFTHFLLLPYFVTRLFSCAICCAIKLLI